MRNLLLALGLLFSGSVMGLEFSPYVGLDAQWNVLRVEQDYKAGTLKKEVPAAQIFAGLRFSENFGLEVGGRLAKGSKSSEGSKYSLHAIHIGPVAYIPLTRSIDLFGTAAISHLSLKLINQDIQALKEKKAVFRYGVGAQFMLEEMVGVRTYLSWEQSSKLANEIVKPKNSMCYNLGVFATF